MAKFLLITRGGTMPASPEEGAKVMQAWTDWFTASRWLDRGPRQPDLRGADRRGRWIGRSR